MIQHFTFERLYAGEMPGWRLSFYYNREKMTALYHGDGEIEIVQPQSFIITEQLKKDIHELMVFHVYDA